jgi:hypothetical protein
MRVVGITASGGNGPTPAQLPQTGILDPVTAWQLTALFSALSEAICRAASAVPFPAAALAAVVADMLLTVPFAIFVFVASPTALALFRPALMPLIFKPGRSFDASGPNAAPRAVCVPTSPISTSPLSTACSTKLPAPDAAPLVIARVDTPAVSGRFTAATPATAPDVNAPALSPKVPPSPPVTRLKMSL